MPTGMDGRLEALPRLPSAPNQHRRQRRSQRRLRRPRLSPQLPLLLSRLQRQLPHRSPPRPQLWSRRPRPHQSLLPHQPLSRPQLQPTQPRLSQRLPPRKRPLTLRRHLMRNREDSDSLVRPLWQYSSLLPGSLPVTSSAGEGPLSRSRWSQTPSWPQRQNSNRSKSEAGTGLKVV